MSETFPKIVIRKAVLHTVVLEGVREAALTFAFHWTGDENEKELTILQRERVGKGGNPQPYQVGPDTWRFDEDGFLIWLSYRIKSSYAKPENRGVKLNELIGKRCFVKCSSVNAVRNAIQRWKSDPPMRFDDEEKSLWYLRSELVKIREGVVGFSLPVLDIESDDLEFFESYGSMDVNRNTDMIEDLSRYSSSHYQMFEASILRSTAHSFERDKICEILRRYGKNDFSDYNDWLICLETLVEIGLQMNFNHANDRIDDLDKARKIPNFKKRVGGSLFEEIHDIRFRILTSRAERIKGNSDQALEILDTVRNTYNLDKDDTRNHGVLQLKAEALIELSRAIIMKENIGNNSVERVRLVKDYLDRARGIYKILRSVDGIMTVNCESVRVGIGLMEKNIAAKDFDMMRVRYREARSDLTYALALRNELTWEEPYGYIDFNAAYLSLYAACIEGDAINSEDTVRIRGDYINSAKKLLSSALRIQRDNKSILMCARSRERLSLSFLLEIALLDDSVKWQDCFKEAKENLRLAVEQYERYCWDDKVASCSKDLKLLNSLDKDNLSEAIRKYWNEFSITSGFLGLTVALGLPANKAESDNVEPHTKS